MSMSRKQSHQKSRFKRRMLLLELIGLLILIAIITYVSKNLLNNEASHTPAGSNETELSEASNKEQSKNKEKLEKKFLKQVNQVVDQANLLAQGYDYEAAIDLLQNFAEQQGEHKLITKALEQLHAEKEKLDPFGAYEFIEQISHVFFHSLIADNAKAFDGDYDSNGYNYYMTTISEFKAMMTEMYNAGYVLVSIHDVAKKETLPDGTTKFVPGDIMLPPDKKPFVLSQDDVNYYQYMEGDGFATKIVLDQNGMPTCEMVLDDGTVSYGSYDLVPLLEDFIAEHPDFSYKGARGILAITGYEGTLGYRTQNSNSPTYEQDKLAVKEVVSKLKELGWEFASHSYGHRDMNKFNYQFLVYDTNKWMEEVGSLIGPTDIYIYPFGSDIENAQKYDSDKYHYLKNSGFDYFCGVYKSPWLQLDNEYVRMTRRPLDGQAMLQFPERLTDLFDINKVVDPARPALK